MEIIHSQYRTHYKSLQNFVQFTKQDANYIFKQQDNYEKQISIPSQGFEGFKNVANFINKNTNYQDLKQSLNIQESEEQLLNKIIDIQQEIIQKISNSENKSSALFIQILEQILEIIKQLETQGHIIITLQHLILYEILKLLKNIDKHQFFTNSFDKFMAHLEISSQLQKILFEQKSLNFSHYLPNIPNKDYQYFKEFEKNQDAFKFFTRLSGALSAKYPQIQNHPQDAPITEFLPVSLTPMEIKKEQYNDLISKTTQWQEVLNQMANDTEWIYNIFKDVKDEFVNRFLNILKKVEQSKTANKTNFTIVRNDFMHDYISDEWLQVEFNTLSSGLVHISDTVQDFQKSITNSYLKQYMQEKNCDLIVDQNKNLGGEGFLQAFNLYNNPEAKVLYIIGDKEWNVYDQRHSELYLAQNGVISIRKTFEQLLEEATFQEDGTFLVGEDEIALIYWRWGYNPKHYYSEQIWELREKIELSKAIKCPNVQLLLINFKKIQVEMQTTDILEKYVKDQEKLENLRQNFAKMYDFQNKEENEKLIEIVQNNPDHWVLKPQREGGGNNIYGQQIYENLSKMSQEEMQNYILMQKIIPRPRVGYALYPDNFEMKGVISELSFWGYFIGNDKQLLQNVKGGYLNRTKKFDENEGGLSVGLSVLDGLMIKKN